MKNGVLYLIPTTLGKSNIGSVWPSSHQNIVKSLNTFIVENLRSARRFLKQTGYATPFDEVTFHLLNKHTDAHDSMSFLNTTLTGNDVGLLSEAGCPCIADPGQIIVSHAHQMGIAVKPLTGPSSIILALMASGMNGQSFCFHGYLPIQSGSRVKKLKELEEAARRTGTTQIFMETPFRNNQLAGDLLKHCRPDTRLCIAANLTLTNEYIRTLTIDQWRNNMMVNLHKQPAIFLLH